MPWTEIDPSEFISEGPGGKKAELPKGSKVEPSTLETAGSQIGKGAIKAVGRNALPIAGGIIGSSVGLIPGGQPFALPAEMALSAGGEYLTQKLGLAEESTPNVVAAGLAPIGARGINKGVSKMTGGSRAMRASMEQKAAAQLKELVPSNVQAAKEFFSQAEGSGRTIPLEIPNKVGGKDVLSTEHHNFTEARARIKGLEDEIQSQIAQGESTKASKKALADLHSQMESTFPGYSKAMKDYPGYAAREDLKHVINKEEPLQSFEQMVNMGKIQGPSGFGHSTKLLSPEEIADTRAVLKNLGPNPGKKAFEIMHKGRIIGLLGGFLLGSAAGGAKGGWEGMGVGGVTGAGASLILPEVFNSLIASGLSTGIGRALIKSAVESKGLFEPHLWVALAQAARAQGIDYLQGSPTLKSMKEQQQQQQAVQQMMQMQQQQGGGENK